MWVGRQFGFCRYPDSYPRDAPPCAIAPPDVSVVRLHRHHVVGRALGIKYWCPGAETRIPSRSLTQLPNFCTLFRRCQRACRRCRAAVELMLVLRHKPGARCACAAVANPMFQTELLAGLLLDLRKIDDLGPPFGVLRRVLLQFFWRCRIDLSANRIEVTEGLISRENGI